MTIHEAQQQLVFQLYEIYDHREAINIADWVMESITEWKKIDRIMNKQVPLLHMQVEQLEHITEQLLQHRPIQYVLGEAWFYGYKFYVNEHVLIPRPETEELVEWIVNDELYAEKQKGEQTPQKYLLDIGTGSGCIAVSIKKQLKHDEVFGIDISADALSVAKKNAAFLDAAVSFQQLDILSEKETQPLPLFDIIVSNPPYIPISDKADMQKHVLEYEPHLALFVENNRPLLFYETIAAFGKKHLHQHGSIYVETHESLANEVEQLFIKEGYGKTILKKDLQEKNRMIKVMF